MVRQGLRSALQAYPNIEVVGEAENGEEAVSKAERLEPTVVVMDINMEKMDGITATRFIKTQYPWGGIRLPMQLLELQNGGGEPTMVGLPALHQKIPKA